MRLRVKVRLERIGLGEREKENEGKEFVCPSRVSVVRLREIVRGKKIGNRRAMIKDYSVSLEHSNNGCMDTLACAKHTYFTRLIYYD